MPPYRFQMATYFIDYDLRNSRDYQKLYDELEKFDAVRVLESQWAFKRDETSTAELRDHFKQFIDSDDGLSIIKSAGWATLNADKTPKDLD
jgi:hypothetical protein